jgi:hypothetical protein
MIGWGNMPSAYYPVSGLPLHPGSVYPLTANRYPPIPTLPQRPSAAFTN